MLTSIDLKPGDQVRLKDYGVTSVGLRRQLLVLGMVPGVQVNIICRAPLGTPLQIEVCGTLIALRQEEIATIQWEHL